MLVLSRKIGEKILVGEDVVLTVVAVEGNRVKIGLLAPLSVTILRAELASFLPELVGASADPTRQAEQGEQLKGEERFARVEAGG